MLIFCGNFEVGKNQQEDKEIIDRKRQLDEVAGDELEPLLVPGGAEKFPAQGTEQKAGKNQRERNPDTAPDSRIPRSDFMRLAIEDTKVNRQHYQDETTKSNPCKCRGRQRVHLAN